ncbi:hypothetical protein SLS56_003196 [Neofusicoccum ribis]|uniref:HAUS augmin-like complex subunit 6 N-terminal domain-containing protein n=1 Tax=Neofusicoccum ribis TaxID=45134 RepID=A0ABR3T1G6_9PEZI
MSRPLSSHSSQAQAPALSTAKSLNLKGCSHQLSSTALFVTNLRLLDFDLYADWPEIAVHTFATRDAQQNQKKRIQCTEWALFRLFELWDPDETREKLSPFFPPLEPLQSLNLRGALYRCLNDLKKNGVLGRETVLRKTMLDECKGDKFMEILVVFSTAVVKKKLSGRKLRRKNVPVARQYATATALSVPQQASLLPLAIAHKAALTNVLRRRDDMRERYMDFGDLLEQKSEEAMDRNEKCGDVLETLEESQKDLPDAASIKRILHDNWLGNPEWIEVMVQGDQPESDNNMFQMQFADIWQRVQLGQQIEEEVSQHHSLLQDLEARVQDQEQRLSRWQAFHDKIQESLSKEPPPEPSKTRNSSVNFRFDSHQYLRLGRARDAEEDHYDPIPSDLSQNYESILADMRDNLAEASKVKSSRPPPKLVHKPKPSSIPMQPAAQRPAFTSRPKAKPEPVEPPSPEPEKSSQPSFDRPVSPDWFSPLGKSQVPTTAPDYERDEPTRGPSPAPSKSTFDDNRSILEQYISDPEEEDQPAAPKSPQATRAPASPNRRSPSPSIPSSPPNPEDMLAEQILAGIDAASPSPAKHPHHQPRRSLTLMERTRLTMEGHTTSPAKPAPTPRSIPPEEAAKAAATAALIERTRQTMLAMADRAPAAAPTAKPGGRARSNSKRAGGGGRRPSLFPPNPWETGRKVSPLFEEWADKVAAEEEAERSGGVVEGRATPRDKLFEEDVDETSVFRSRPKIAASPLLAPDEDGASDGVSELGGGEVFEDAEEEYGFEDAEESFEGESSPLRGKGR